MHRIRTNQQKTMKATEKKYILINNYKTEYLLSFVWLLFSSQVFRL